MARIRGPSLKGDFFNFAQRYPGAVALPGTVETPTLTQPYMGSLTTPTGVTSNFSKPSEIGGVPKAPGVPKYGPTFPLKPPTTTTDTGRTPPVFGPGGKFGGSAATTGGGGGGGSTLTGAPPRDYTPESGGVPGTTNPLSTILANLGGFGSLIGGLTNDQLTALRSQYPDQYFSTLGTLLANVQRRAAGDISDLMPELQTRDAEAAVGGGFPGSAMANTKLLRDLGLTRYGVEEQARKGLLDIQNLIPRVGPYDPSSVIAALIDAQKQADIMRGAPNPDAYRKLLERLTHGGGGGGGSGPGGGVVPATLRLPPGGGSVDDVLKRYGGALGGYPPPIIEPGTKRPEGPQGLPPLPFGNVPGEWEGEDAWLSRIFGPGYDETGGPTTQGPPDITGTPWAPRADDYNYYGDINDPFTFAGDIDSGYGYEPWEYND